MKQRASAMRACHARFQRGISLVELMIASALGLLVILAAIGLLVVSRHTYVTLDEKIAVQEVGHYALAILARSVRQASWTRGKEDGKETAMPGPATGLRTGILGLDNRSLRMSSENIESPIAAVSQGSDVLAIRFDGAEDASMLNCAGFAVDGVETAERGWSIFFIGGERNSEPELRCKYRGKNSWRTEGIARGVESFQVLYGINTDGSGLPNQFVNASRIEQLNADLNGEEDEEESEGNDYWSKVVAVRIALLVRSSRKLDEAGPSPPYHLFGASYSTLHGASDRGTLVREEDIPADSRLRLRRVFVTTIPLRNAYVRGDG